MLTDAALHVAPGFEPVRDAFMENFDKNDELGAAFAATLDGQPVVDLWGGIADAETGRSWQQDTIQVIFSGTKGLTATCILMLVDRGQIELEAPVATYWPEFAAAGKDSITVAEVMSHRARLPGVRVPLTEADLLDPRAMASRLAEQAPEKDPRAAGAYHALTYGWLCDELLWRVEGRSISSFFADEIAEPLGLEVWIGLPPELEPRVAPITRTGDWSENAEADPELWEGDDLYASIWANPPVLGPTILFNRTEWHEAEIPAANGIATARSLARLYGCLARGGELDGVRLLQPETLELGQRELARFTDPFAQKLMVYGAGFQLQTPKHLLGPPAVAFGHDGAGGGVHGAWPAERVGFSYSMNGMHPGGAPDPRSVSLLAALHACLEM
jgi:CubicO group peptidase (beta-lactamase class C family)